MEPKVWIIYQEMQSLPINLFCVHLPISTNSSTFFFFLLCRIQIELTAIWLLLEGGLRSEAFLLTLFLFLSLSSFQTFKLMPAPLSFNVKHPPSLKSQALFRPSLPSSGSRLIQPRTVAAKVFQFYFPLSLQDSVLTTFIVCF